MVPGLCKPIHFERYRGGWGD